MNKNIRKYFVTLKSLFDNVIATDKRGKLYNLERAIDISLQLIKKQASRGGKLLFIGNGASASISSHMATDFWKNGGIPALAFNDSSLLTCVSNDYGYEHVFEKPIEMFIEQRDILIAISSSGKSENILRGVWAAKKREVKVITLSGFKRDNPLRKLGDINFYVPFSNYGYVETIHQAICHSMVDMVTEKKNG